ncbi:MAG: hypothetical protein KDD62_13505, partial [Bdellovibrionales bacterium]|nr:hypothetical protein [Bdellovibrionales bacterium]
MPNFSETELNVRQFTSADWNWFCNALKNHKPDSALASWSDKDISDLLHAFPEGQICVEVNGQPVAAALGLTVRYSIFAEQHTFEDIMNRLEKAHDSKKGDTYYCIETFIEPDYHDRALDERMYDAGKALCERLNLKGIFVGNRIQSYKEYQDSLSPRDYIDKVQKGELPEPLLWFQLSNNFHVKRILKDYLP